MPLIRLAASSDAPALAALNAAFNEVNDVTAQDVRRSLTNNAEIVVVAEIGGCVVGFCCAQVHRSFCYRTPEAEITEMYVDPHHRRQGLGRGMLDFMAGHLRREHGADGLHLLTGCTNLAAQALYERCGFRIKPEAFMTRSL